MNQKIKDYHEQDGVQKCSEWYLETAGPLQTHGNVDVTVLRCVEDGDGDYLGYRESRRHIEVERHSEWERH